jgi:hypothetical protein
VVEKRSERSVTIEVKGEATILFKDGTKTSWLLAGEATLELADGLSGAANFTINGPGAPDTNRFTRRIVIAPR